MKLTGLRQSKNKFAGKKKSRNTSQCSQSRSLTADDLHFGEDIEDDEIDNCVTISDQNIAKMKADLKGQRARMLTKNMDEKHLKEIRKKNVDKVINMIGQSDITNHNRIKDEEPSSNMVS